MSKSRIIGRKALVAAIAATALIPAAAQAAEDTVGAQASFRAGQLTVTAPQTGVSFGETQLDGRAAYNLTGDVADWNVTDATGALSGWEVTAAASDPVASDDGTNMSDAVMTMRGPQPEGTGPAPSVDAGDADGFVGLTDGGAQMVSAAADAGIGNWDMRQTGAGDIKLVMPYNVKPVTYNSTITFTLAQGITS